MVCALTKICLIVGNIFHFDVLLKTCFSARCLFVDFIVSANLTKNRESWWMRKCFVDLVLVYIAENLNHKSNVELCLLDCHRHSHALLRYCRLNDMFLDDQNVWRFQRILSPGIFQLNLFTVEVTYLLWNFQTAAAKFSLFFEILFNNKDTLFYLVTLHFY